MFTDAIELAVAILGLGMVGLSIRQARAKGAAASLQMAAGGFLLTGAAAIGIVGFVVGLVLSPMAWVGVGMLALAGVLFAVGQKVEAPSDRAKGRGEVTSSADEPAGEVTSGKGKKNAKNAKGAKGTKSEESAGDGEMDDIEAILRKHGIE